jgi:DNA-binding MarR family transcriptional regulator
MPPRQARVGAPPAGSPADIADRLHSAAIHLLRRLRREDDASGLGAPRLSALSVIVFGGPITIGGLAEAEQVRAPTMSRLVNSLEEQGLVQRVPDIADRRVVRVEATAAGAALLHAGRARRVAALTADVARLSRRDQDALLGTLGLLETLAGR